MVSEKRILHTLDLITTASLSSLGAAKQEAVRQMRQILGGRNLVGIGISEKISSARGATGKLALVFYVEKKRDARKLKGREMVPPALPEVLSRGRPILTDVVELGKIRPGRAVVPRSGIRPKRGMQVTLDGKARIGFVRDTNFRLLVSYDGTGDVDFREQVLTTPYGRAFGGAVVVERHTGRPVGCHAGAVQEGCLFHPAAGAVQAKVPGLPSGTGRL
jgi:hypothetical protein